MASTDRERELEAQVAALRAEVAHLHAAAAGPRAGAEAPLVEQVRATVERAIRAEADGALEAQVGAVWLGRLAMLATMTFLVLGARFTVGIETLGAWQKVAAGYAVAAAFAGYGLRFRARADAFTQAMMGCGLAALYFTTYAAFFVDEMRLVPWPPLGMAALLGCLLLLGGVAHAWRSQTVAGIGLFLAYYTVALSAALVPDLQSLVYVLATCTALAVFTLILHATHQWLALSWGAMAATQGAFLYFFRAKPPGLDLPDAAYFWIATGCMTVCYLLFSLVAIVDARRRGEYRRTVAPMAAFNSIVYFAATYGAVRAQFPDYAWLFLASFGALLLGFALLAETTGPHRNYLFQVFAVKAVILFVLALRSYLAPETYLVAWALAAVLLALVHRITGVVAFKVMGIALGIIVLGAAFLSLRMAGSVHLGAAALPARAVNAAGVAAMFAAAAVVYEKLVRPMPPERRSSSGQWFLADTWLDAGGGTAALGFAAGAALLLMAFSILHLGHTPLLPFVLAAQAALFLACGAVFAALPLEVGGLLLLAAGHVCFYIFLLLPEPGFGAQPHFAAYTVVMALLTYAGAYAFERCLLRVHADESDLDHYAVAAAPYWMATALLAALLHHTLDPLLVPAACAALGLVLLALGVALRGVGLEASALLALAAGTGFFYLRLDDPQTPLVQRADFLLWLGLFIAAFAAAERMVAWAPRRPHRPERLERLLRSAFVAITVAVGVLGLRAWSRNPDVMVFYLLGQGLATLAFGALCRERRYRWGGIALFLAAIAWAFAHFQGLSPAYRIVTFGACAAVLLIVSWLYARRRRAAPAPGPSHG